MTNSKTTNLRISEGIILALSSAGAYLFAFYYEKGFASVFSIPVSFITITLTSILTFGAILLGVILFSLPGISLLLTFTESNTRPILKRTLLPIIIAVILLFVQFYFFGIDNWEQLLPIIIIVFLIVLLQLVLPLIKQKSGKYIDKLEAYEKERAADLFVDAAVVVRDRFGNAPIIIVLIFLFGITIAGTAGRSEAIKQEEFLVTNTTPEMVVLRIYGDNMICVPFDRITGEIEKDFTVLKITDDSDLVLKLENIGQLHLPIVTPVVQSTPTPLPTGTPVPAPTNKVP